MSPRKSREAGFSLLETLLGLTLTALIAVLMTGSLQTGARVWERSSGPDLPGARQLIESRVSDWIAQASPAGIQPPADGDPAFAGDGRQVSFIIAGQNLGGPPGIYRVRLVLAPAEDCPGGRALVVSTRLLSPGEQPAMTQEESVATRTLLPCLANPKFEFYGKSGPEDAPLVAWMPDWSGADGPPLIMRLQSTEPGSASTVVLAQRIARATR